LSHMWNTVVSEGSGNTPVCQLQWHASDGHPELMTLGLVWTSD